ncbi:D-lactate dehydrogenase [Psychrosphaera sp. B3R10]|uniref:D-lactate dehydrogenase n=1 Tax=unclassified Psychrosphaera TaxID=2641570 RepID=UPI001C096584|nr:MULTISPECIES: D-lactate dehydrogenase [unclassified Psychrosphaera]MBU2880692.1 D-lactate dehydrogenase [Psychrosphaera sp. I2R16]MBU2991562.1 D-lactate dehydrogenase [Psychrosphaera sp. B3R10]
MPQQSLIACFKKIVGPRNVLTSERATAPYRKGFREGQGPALAVVKPTTLWQQWQLLEACVNANVIVVMQAANTGLTGGSTPTQGCDRNTVIINTTQINDIHVLDKEQQIVALPGASLFSLEKALAPYGRVPHSVIGSSCIGASIVGGICNNSGGALVERGPAYTELALYAQIDEAGSLRLVNELDIELGETVEEILTNLQNKTYSQDDIKTTEKLASDRDYADWVRKTTDDTPARFNADPRRLHQASGCAGKLAVFAVRVDTFLKNEQEHTFYVGTNSTQALQKVRTSLLEKATNLPVYAEYLHRDIFELADNYGRDTVLLIKHLGTNWLPKFFNVKRQLDALCRRIPFLKQGFIDKVVYRIAKLFPSQTPKTLHQWNDKFEHQLILTVKGDEKDVTELLLNEIKTEYDLDYFLCTEADAKSAYLLRFAAAGAAVQYAAINHKKVEDIVALDIALKRNDTDWFETLPEHLNSKLVSKLYYGHFLCHVFHQDYLVRSGEDPKKIKQALLALLEIRGAEYPAEHNVGHHYHAKPALADNYRMLDPTNTLNAGIGGMSKNRNYRES